MMATAVLVEPSTTSMSMQFQPISRKATMSFLTIPPTPSELQSSSQNARKATLELSMFGQRVRPAAEPRDLFSVLVSVAQQSLSPTVVSRKGGIQTTSIPSAMSPRALAAIRALSSPPPLRSAFSLDLPVGRRRITQQYDEQPDEDEQSRRSNRQRKPKQDDAFVVESPFDEPVVRQPKRRNIQVDFESNSDDDDEGKRRRPNFSRESRHILQDWLNAHLDHPYPSDQEKRDLSVECGISHEQICNWFVNARMRYTKRLAEGKTTKQKRSSQFD